MKAEDRALTEAAASVADGVPVDWSSTEARADPRTRRLVHHLRLVESISALYRSLPDGPDGQVAADPRVAAKPKWGQLLLLDRIGQGTSGDVFRAWDPGLQREVALKLLRETAATPAAESRMLEEARRLARVRHPHVVHVYGAELHDNRVGLWMELVRGESLDRIVTTRGPFGAHEATVVGLDLCAALAAVHAAGLLHRDVKAQNVLREAGGRIVLMDFGTGQDLTAAVADRLVGTPLCLAPELFRGDPGTVQSDLYSLGVLLFFLVTSEFPVRAESMRELVRAHEQGSARRLRDLRPDVPHPFVRVVERALDPDPRNRYRSAGEMELALRQALDARSEILPPPVRPPAGSARSWIVPMAAVALAILLIALVVWIRWPPLGSVSIVNIAVLPLEDRSPIPSSHLADGLTDQLIATLGQIQALRVTSRTSVMPFKATDMPLPEIANTLGVEGLVTGTVTVARGESGGADTLRVEMRLMTAGGTTPRWSQTFERAVGDLAALQGDIARAIAAATSAPVSAKELERLTGRQATSAAAEEAYFQGRLHVDHHGIGRADLALKAFQRAVELDPGYAAARAGAALAYISLGFNGAMPHSAAHGAALGEVRSALELNDELPEAHAALAHIRFLYDWDWASAERAFRRSLELNPSSIYARTYYAEYLAALGRFPEAVEQSALARQLDPQSGPAARRHTIILYYQRDFEGARAAIRDALAIEPGAAGALIVLGRVEEAQGNVANALEATTRAAQLANGGGVPLRVQLIRLWTLAGRSSEARSALDALKREAAGGGLRITPRDVAYIRLAFGEYDGALEALDQALHERDPSLVWLGVDPRLDGIRGAPRFQAILRTIGLR